MKKAIKCVNCNTYFEVDHIYDGKITIYLNCKNCKFPLRIKTIDLIVVEIISLLSDKKYFDEVKRNFMGYSKYLESPTKPPINYNFNF